MISNRAAIFGYISSDAPTGKYLPPPMGILYLAATLRQHQIPVRVFDFQFEKTSWRELEKIVDSTTSCMLGFSCDSNNIHRVIQVSNRLLKRYPHLYVVLGGHHVTHKWAPYVSERRVVVRGEGEYPALMLARCLLYKEGNLNNIPGIAFVQDGKMVCNEVFRGPFEDVDSIPFPAYDLLPQRANYIASAITGRGCSYHCYFCSQGGAEITYRPRSLKNVQDELIKLKKHYNGRINHLRFLDDTFTVSRKRVNEICMMLDRIFPDKADFSFFCEGRVDILARYPKLIHRLKEAGLVQLQIGIESGNQDLLDQMNKKSRADQVETVVSASNDAEIPSVIGVFLGGLPYQTRDAILKDLEFAKHLADLAPGRINMRMVSLAPYPGIEYTKNASKWGLTILDEELASGRIGECFSDTTELKREEIASLCRRFNSEIEEYLIEKASWLSPLAIKKYFSLGARIPAPFYLVKKLTRFRHVNLIHQLLHREDHCFLHEMPDEDIPEATPVSAIVNIITPINNGFRINQGSPFTFDLSGDEMQYYRFFNAKLSFFKIAVRMAELDGVSAKAHFFKCLDVYKKCEDKLAAIVLR